jgi:predicted alpha/beta superfamily hydrolase
MKRALLLALVTACGAKPAVPATEPAPPHTTFTFDSRILGETRRINVYTAPGWYRGPVVTMLDGGLAEDFPHVTRSVDAAVRAGEMRPVIVVGIENTDRRRDLTGPTDVPEELAAAPRAGGSIRFRSFLTGELRPELARRLPPHAETGIIGESLAGLFVVETLLLTPEAFDVYIALSPSLWWSRQAVLRSAPGHLAALDARPRRLYFAYASDDDLEEASDQLAAALRAHAPPSLSWSFHPQPQATHATIYRTTARAVLTEIYRRR